MKQPLLIVGAGESALIARYYFSQDSNYDVVAFSAESAYLKDAILDGLPVVPYEELATNYSSDRYSVFVAMSFNQMNRLRRLFYTDLEARGWSIATYISSKAAVARNAVFGKNTFVGEGCVIHPYVRVGSNVMLCPTTVVGHRTVISDHVWSVGAFLCGFCKIGDGAFLGARSIYNDNVSVGAYTLIAAGAVVTGNAESKKVYAGHPARAVPGLSSFEARLSP